MSGDTTAARGNDSSREPAVKHVNRVMKVAAHTSFFSRFLGCEDLAGAPPFGAGSRSQRHGSGQRRGNGGRDAKMTTARHLPATRRSHGGVNGKPVSPGDRRQVAVRNDRHVQTLRELAEFDPLSASGQGKLERDNTRVLRAHAGSVQLNATPQDDGAGDEGARAGRRRARAGVVIGVDAARAGARGRNVGIGVTQGTPRTELAAVPLDAAVQRSQTPVGQSPLPKADHRIGKIWCGAGGLAIVRHRTGEGSRGESVSPGSGSGSGATVGTTAGALGTWTGSTVIVRDGPGNVAISARSRSSSIDTRSS